MRLPTSLHAQYRARIGRPPDFPLPADQIFVTLDPEGQISGVMETVCLHPGLALMLSPRWFTDPPPPAPQIFALVRETFEQARQWKTAEIGIRLLERGNLPPVQDALRALGFCYIGERIEYVASVRDLPDDVGTPLRWSDLSVVGFEQAAAMLGRVSEGDPQGEPEHNHPQKALQGYLDEEDLCADPECVQIGTIEGEPAAFVCAQAMADGWCRITYMGIVPAFRGRELGRWVHRQGFSMMRSQGGTRYQGGTATDNRAMMRMFEVHGCRVLRRMFAWTWSCL